MRWIATRLLSIILIAAYIWVMGLLWFITQIAQAPMDNDATVTDVIVVLTGGAMRVETGLELLARGKARTLFISGVGKGVKVSELLREAHKTTPKLPRLQTDKIVLGYEASDTRGNAEETARFMESEGYASLRLVTSNYHMPRAVYEFHATMPAVTILPSPVLSTNFRRNEWWLFKGTAALAISEYHKTLASMFHRNFGNYLPEEWHYL